MEDTQRNIYVASAILDALFMIVGLYLFFLTTYRSVGMILFFAGAFDISLSWYFYRKQQFYSRELPERTFDETILIKAPNKKNIKKVGKI